MDSQRVAVCQVDQLQVGEMQQVSAFDREILLARTDAGFSAIAAHCSHYGAPLPCGKLRTRRRFYRQLRTRRRQ